MTIYGRYLNDTLAYWGSLPVSYQNISGFNRLSDEELRAYGFYPITFIEAEYNNLTQTLDRSNPEVNFDEDNYTLEVIYNVVNKSEDALAELKVQYSTSSINAFNDILRATDWTQLVDSGLDMEEKTSYDNLRADIITYKANVESYDLVDIYDIHNEAAAASNYFYQRENAFTQTMIDFAGSLNILVNA